MNYRFTIIPTLIMAVLWAAPALADNAGCLECHDNSDAMLGFLHDKGEVQCTACHGDSSEHQQRPRTPPTVSFTPLGSGDQLNGACLDCHDDGARIHWESVAHGDADVACNGCHSIHQKRDAVLVKNQQMEVCVSCHKDVQAQFNLPSHHPVKEGQALCADCHASHGSTTDASLAKASLNDTCASCHREMQGPFIFEHDPVAEDCGLCHKPHGSVLPSLLTSRPPFLCQQCHLAAGHPSRLPDGTSMNDLNIRAKSCGNCHSAVHGSNHPSGARLTR